MKEAVAIHFIDRPSNKVWLAYQQFKIIGLKTYGGKIKKGKTPEEAAVDETDEETGRIPEFRINPEEAGGIVFDPKDLKRVGLIDFYNGPEEEVPFGEPSFRVLFYNCYEFEGKPISTVEMLNPGLYAIDALPEKELVVGDELFIYQLLREESTRGWIRRTADFKEVIAYEIIPCTVEDLVI